MSQALTPKQERFCLAYIETGNASEAYRQAYDADGMKPASVNRAAKALTDNPKIAARIDILRERQQKRHDVTMDSITEELEEARALARVAIQPSAMVSASLGKAKLHGLMVEKNEVTGKDGNPIEISDAKAALLRGLVPHPAPGGAETEG